MRYTDLSDIGGFLWWLLIKFCKTDLKDEQKENKWSRNILTLLLFGLLFVFITIILMCYNIQNQSTRYKYSKPYRLEIFSPLTFRRSALGLSTNFGRGERFNF